MKNEISAVRVLTDKYHFPSSECAEWKEVAVLVERVSTASTNSSSEVESNDSSTYVRVERHFYLRDLNRKYWNDPVP